MTGDGLAITQGLAQQLDKPYVFRSVRLNDGKNSDEGALGILRQPQYNSSTVVFKATSQGLGHGHFDKLNWLFYDNGHEVITDYGASRFLNIEAKYGGHYLPENESWAKQTIAHNTLVVNETSHFDGLTEIGNKFHPKVTFFESNTDISIMSASMNDAYKNIEFRRTIALINNNKNNIVIDLLNIDSIKNNQYDLPLYYSGQLINTNFNRKNNTNILNPLGNKNGYQHLWLTSSSTPKIPFGQITWLNSNNRFYTLTTLFKPKSEILFVQLGANDPNDNLRSEKGFIIRQSDERNTSFISVLESHGEYNPSEEYTLMAKSQIKELKHTQKQDLDIIEITFIDNNIYLLAFDDKNDDSKDSDSNFNFNGKDYHFDGNFGFFKQLKAGK